MWLNHPAVMQCCRQLSAGGLIAYPTEAVWGLGCDPFSHEALHALLELKQRPWQKGVILVAANIEQFDFLLHDLAASERRQLAASWPGHNTWLVKHRGRVSPLVHGSHDSVALRVSAHPVVRALCLRFGGPLTSSSANPGAMPPARTALRARKYFGRRAVVFAPGRVGSAQQPSVIRDLASGRIVRS